MPFLVLGVALLVGLLLAAKWFASADPKSMVKVLKWVAVPFIAAIGIYLIVTGRIAIALMLLPVLIPWLARLRSAATAAKNHARMSDAGGGGQNSTVETRFLRMTLNHDSGAMAGEVREGAFAGRSLDSLILSELIELLNECLRSDAPSAKVLETYLDRVHEGWRDFVRPGGAGKSTQDGGAFAGGPMSRDESYKILGLEPGASVEEIKAAYHRLMGALHPDKGGSTYLAAKLNEAKEVLLQGH